MDSVEEILGKAGIKTGSISGTGTTHSATIIPNVPRTLSHDVSLPLSTSKSAPDYSSFKRTLSHQPASATKSTSALGSMSYAFQGVYSGGSGVNTGVNTSVYPQPNPLTHNAYGQTQSMRSSFTSQALPVTSTGQVLNTTNTSSVSNTLGMSLSEGLNYNSNMPNPSTLQSQYSSAYTNSLLGPSALNYRIQAGSTGALMRSLSSQLGTAAYTNSLQNNATGTLRRSISNTQPNTQMKETVNTGVAVDGNGDKAESKGVAGSTGPDVKNIPVGSNNSNNNNSSNTLTNVETLLNAFRADPTQKASDQSSANRLKTNDSGASTKSSEQLGASLTPNAFQGMHINTETTKSSVSNAPPTTHLPSPLPYVNSSNTQSQLTTQTSSDTTNPYIQPQPPNSFANPNPSPNSATNPLSAQATHNSVSHAQSVHTPCSHLQVNNNIVNIYADTSTHNTPEMYQGTAPAGVANADFDPKTMLLKENAALLAEIEKLKKVEHLGLSEKRMMSAFEIRVGQNLLSLGCADEISIGNAGDQNQENPDSNGAGAKGKSTASSDGEEAENRTEGILLKDTDLTKVMGLVKDRGTSLESPVVVKKKAPSHKPAAQKKSTAKATKADATKATKSDATKTTKADTKKATKADATKATKADTTKATKADSTKATKADTTKASKADSTKASKADTTKATKEKQPNPPATKSNSKKGGNGTNTTAPEGMILGPVENHFGLNLVEITEENFPNGTPMVSIMSPTKGQGMSGNANLGQKQSKLPNQGAIIIGPIVTHPPIKPRKKYTKKKKAETKNSSTANSNTNTVPPKVDGKESAGGGGKAKTGPVAGLKEAEKKTGGVAGIGPPPRGVAITKSTGPNYGPGGAGTSGPANLDTVNKSAIQQGAFKNTPTGAAHAKAQGEHAAGTDVNANVNPQLSSLPNTHPNPNGYGKGYTRPHAESQAHALAQARGQGSPYHTQQQQQQQQQQKQQPQQPNPNSTPNPTPNPNSNPTPMQQQTPGYATSQQPPPHVAFASRTNSTADIYGQQSQAHAYTPQQQMQQQQQQQQQSMAHARGRTVYEGAGRGMPAGMGGPIGRYGTSHAPGTVYRTSPYAQGQGSQQSMTSSVGQSMGRPQPGDTHQAKRNGYGYPPNNLGANATSNPNSNPSSNPNSTSNPKTSPYSQNNSNPNSRPSPNAHPSYGQGELGSGVHEGSVSGGGIYGVNTMGAGAPYSAAYAHRPSAIGSNHEARTSSFMGGNPNLGRTNSSMGNNSNLGSAPNLGGNPILGNNTDLDQNLNTNNPGTQIQGTKRSGASADGLLGPGIATTKAAKKPRKKTKKQLKADAELLEKEKETGGAKGPVQTQAYNHGQLGAAYIGGNGGGLFMNTNTGMGLEMASYSKPQPQPHGLAGDAKNRPSQAQVIAQAEHWAQQSSQNMQKTSGWPGSDYSRFDNNNNNTRNKSYEDANAGLGGLETILDSGGSRAQAQARLQPDAYKSGSNHSQDSYMLQLQLAQRLSQGKGNEAMGSKSVSHQQQQHQQQRRLVQQGMDSGAQAFSFRNANAQGAGTKQSPGRVGGNGPQPARTSAAGQPSTREYAQSQRPGEQGEVFRAHSLAHAQAHAQQKQLQNQHTLDRSPADQTQARASPNHPMTTTKPTMQPQGYQGMYMPGYGMPYAGMSRGSVLDAGQGQGMHVYDYNTVHLPQQQLLQQQPQQSGGSAYMHGGASSLTSGNHYGNGGGEQSHKAQQRDTLR